MRRSASHERRAAGARLRRGRASAPRSPADAAGTRAPTPARAVFTCAMGGRPLDARTRGLHARGDRPASRPPARMRLRRRARSDRALRRASLLRAERHADERRRGEPGHSQRGRSVRRRRSGRASLRRRRSRIRWSRPTRLAPAGWSAEFPRLVANSVLAGYSAFAKADALRAGRLLLERGPVRLKLASGIAGMGQWTADDEAGLMQVLDTLADDEVAAGLVIEENLVEVVTHSVGCVRIAEMAATYCGVQRTTTNNHGVEVYGGSELRVVRGGFSALLALDLPVEVRLAIAQARVYDDAADRCFPGFFASRRNYDVAQGTDTQGPPALRRARAIVASRGRQRRGDRRARGVSRGCGAAHGARGLARNLWRRGLATGRRNGVFSGDRPERGRAHEVHRRPTVCRHAMSRFI